MSHFSDSAHQSAAYVHPSNQDYDIWIHDVRTLHTHTYIHTHTSTHQSTSKHTSGYAYAYVYVYIYTHKYKLCICQPDIMPFSSKCALNCSTGVKLYICISACVHIHKVLCV